MNSYNIAGLKVNMSPFGRAKKQAERYKTEFCSEADITINVSENTLLQYIQKQKVRDRETAYYLASGFAFYRQLLNFGGFMLHSSAVCIDGGAYLFSGPSGVGKSTHTKLWLELLKEKAFIINDDKPAIRVTEKGVFACGTPWSGKDDVSRNICVPVKGICFIERAQTNSIVRLDNKTAALRIIEQCTKNFTEEGWDKILYLINAFVNSVSAYKIMCNKDISAAKLSYTTMTGELI